MIRDTEDVVALVQGWINRGCSSWGIPAHEIAQLLADRQSLSDRIDELEGVVDDAASCLKEAGHTISRLEHGSLGNRNFAYVAADHARAALHQEGIAPDVGRNPATHEPSPVSRSRP